MIRTYYLTVEGDKDDILEHHGRIMTHLRGLPGKRLSASISFDERNMKKELMRGAVTVMGESGKGLIGLAKKGWKELG